MPAWTKRRARRFATGWNVCEPQKNKRAYWTQATSHAVALCRRLQQCVRRSRYVLTTRNSRYSPAALPGPRLAGQGRANSRSIPARASYSGSFSPAGRIHAMAHRVDAFRANVYGDLQTPHACFDFAAPRPLRKVRSASRPRSRDHARRLHATCAAASQAR